jgi:hypothetical protein
LLRRKTLLISLAQERMLHTSLAGTGDSQSVSPQPGLTTTTGVACPPNTISENPIMLANPRQANPQSNLIADFPRFPPLRPLPSLSTHGSPYPSYGHSQRQSDTWSLRTPYSTEYSTTVFSPQPRYTPVAHLGFERSPRARSSAAGDSTAVSHGPHAGRLGRLHEVAGAR